MWKTGYFLVDTYLNEIREPESMLFTTYPTDMKFSR